MVDIHCCSTLVDGVFWIYRKDSFLVILLMQDPGTKAAKRVWTSINVGTEIYISSQGATAEWSVSDFDVLILEDDKFGVSAVI